MNKRNGSIELLRFLFANFVVWHHAVLPVFKGGWLGVEFFFFLSGLFMAKSLDKNRENYAAEPMAVTVKESSKYLLNRYMGIFPYMIISTLLGFTVQTLSQNFGTTIQSAAEYLLRLPYEVFFLQNYGFASISCIGTVWYLSAMFFALWVLYPIMRRQYDLYVGYLAPMVAILLTGYLMRTMGTLAGSAEILPSGLNAGFVRAVAEISWGAFLYKISVALSKRVLSVRMKTLITLVEVVSYAWVVYRISIWQIPMGVDDPIVALAMSVGLVITTSGQSLFHGTMDNRFTAFLGKISMVLYMNHAYWLFNIVSLCQRVGIQTSEMRMKAIGLLLSYATTLIVYYLGNALQRLITKVKHRHKDT